MKGKLIFGILLFIIISLTPSCDSSSVFDSYYHIENASWKWDDVASFSFNNDDTTSLHNILIQVRHTTDYPLSNLYMFVHVNGPSGQVLTDTINFQLAEISGEWIGKGTGNIRELAYLFRKNTIFPEEGEYGIRIEQAMRLPAVPVSDVGLRIETITP